MAPFRAHAIALALGLAGERATLVAAAADADRNWAPSLTVAAREAFDSNVHLQDMGDLRRRESFVTTLLPVGGLTFDDKQGLQAAATYAPELNWFHSEPGEDFILHRVSARLSGTAPTWSWDLQNLAVAIDGSGVGPTFTGPGGAPAAGGPQIRDRRDAFMYRGGIKASAALGTWTLRPAVTAYLHDWQTEHRATPGYLNYVDRNEFTAGADAGRELVKGLRGFAGYRFGTQDQSRLLSYPEEYDSTFHRALFGVEGAVGEALKITVSLGPEFRRYGDDVSPSFPSRDVVNLFVDASATLSLTQRHAITAGVRQFEQPSFAGRGAYEDLTIDLGWKGTITDKLTVGASLRAYNTDFLEPALRNDWVLGASGYASYAFTPKLTAELSIALEDGESRVPATEGRDYTRNVIALGVKHRFW